MKNKTKKEKRWFCLDLPVTEYKEAWNLQAELVTARKERIIESDVVVLLEHSSVFTLGHNAGLNDLMVSEDFLKEKGIQVIKAERGGNITYHGPGQLIMYPIIDLHIARLGVSELIERLEEVMIRTASDFGIETERNSINRGVWVKNRKIGSVGIAVRRGISFHGLAININLNMMPFTWINPCGLKNVDMTSIEQELSRKVSMREARKIIKKHTESVFDIELKKMNLKELDEILKERQNHASKKYVKKPHWLKRNLPTGPSYENVRSLLNKSRLHTVCQEAKCPNIWECFSQRTSTFLIMGPRCTRNCRFCAVEQGPSGLPDPEEPERVAEAARNMGLSYVVITSVTRDDLPDGGAGHFAKTIREVRKKIPNACIEVLIPDFQGDMDALQIVLDAQPAVLNHNIETVPSLYPSVRPKAIYWRSIRLLMHAGLRNPAIPTKSGIMLGLGETPEEIEKILKDLVDVGCSILTIGQYLQPTREHLPVRRFVPPEEFMQWKKSALKMGFSDVASGPFVRSSYHAKDLYDNRMVMYTKTGLF
ncbi:MAG: lipoyl synthase [bacterium]